MYVSHLFAGKPVPFGPNQSPSSIIKAPFETLHIELHGALEDEQGNKKLHGGPYMALHQYAQQSYALLQDKFDPTGSLFKIGSIGENLSAPNMTENNVYMGDEYKIGEVVLKVVSPRAPCSKINHRYNIPKVDRYIASTGITGWYYQVLQTGKMHTQDPIELVLRQSVPFSVKTVWDLRNADFTSDHINQAIEQCSDLLASKQLSPEWQGHITRKLNKLIKQGRQQNLDLG